MKRLLLLDDDPKERMLLATLLSPHYALQSPEPGEDPLKAARLLIPDVAFIALHRYKPDASLRLCRMLKTDLAPVRHVAIYSSGTGPPPEEVFGPWMADGYLGGQPQLPQLLQFLQAMERGERPCISPPPPPHGILKKLLHRIRRA